MSNFYASDPRSRALDHIEAVKATADTDGLSSTVEAGLKLAEVYALLAIADAIAAGPRTTTGGRLLPAGGVDYSGRPEVPC